MSNPQEWVVVARESDLQENARLVVTVYDRSILLLKRAGRLFAVENKCPHLGCKLARGKIEGFLITCPCHDWVFDIRDGAFIEAREITVPVFPLRVQNDYIYIQVERPGG